MSSAIDHEHAAPHGHDAGGHDAGGHGSHDAGSHGTFRGYVTGFVLSVILTAVPFWLVMANVLDSSLYMNTKSEGGWTIMALSFTLTVVVITLAGSIWIMYHLDQNMVPMMSGHDLMHSRP